MSYGPEQKSALKSKPTAKRGHAPSKSVNAVASSFGRVGMNRTKASKRALSKADQVKVIVMLLLGIILQSLAQLALGPILFAPALLALGCGLISIAFPGKKPELRAFLLAFSACVLVAGLAQCYSQMFFGRLQTTRDASHFIYNLSREVTWDEMISQNISDAPLAIQIWKFFYVIPEMVGILSGPYVPITFNALTMGLVGSLSVQTARVVFGDDDRRLRKVGTLVAFYGLFLLFGGVLLRDSLTTFVNVLLFLGLVRWIARPTIIRLLTAVASTVLYIFSISYLRPEALFLPAVYWALALSLGFLVGSNRMRLLVVFISLLVVIIGGNYVVSYFSGLREVTLEENETYIQYAEEYRDGSSSLGMAILVNQPMPVRIFVGSFMQMVSPIPLWAYFRTDMLDYNWIKGYNGIYQMFILPFVFVGVRKVYRLFISSQPNAKILILLFVTMYVILNLLGISVTSMEQRHFAQFFPGVAILAAIPNTRRLTIRREVQQMSKYWWQLVVGVHAAWIVLKIVT